MTNTLLAPLPLNKRPFSFLFLPQALGATYQQHQQKARNMQAPHAAGQRRLARPSDMIGPPLQRAKLRHSAEATGDAASICERAHRGPRRHGYEVLQDTAAGPCRSTMPNEHDCTAADAEPQLRLGQAPTSLDRTPRSSPKLTGYYLEDCSHAATTLCVLAA